MIGRPSIFTEELALVICDRISGGESLRSVCRDEEMPDKSTVFRWLAAWPLFRDQYARACEARADAMAEEIIEISDDGSNDSYEDENGNKRTDVDVIARSRLRVDARKWIMARVAPKKYGDKVTQEIQGKDGGPVEIRKIERVIVDAPKAAGPLREFNATGGDWAGS